MYSIVGKKKNGLVSTVDVRIPTHVGMSLEQVYDATASKPNVFSAEVDNSEYLFEFPQIYVDSKAVSEIISPIEIFGEIYCDGKDLLINYKYKTIEMVETEYWLDEDGFYYPEDKHSSDVRHEVLMGKYILEDGVYTMKELI